jgi:hypothetical protein
MPGPDFEPLEGLSEEDKSYLDSHKNAFQRQAAARAGDEARKKAAEEHMRSVRTAAGFPPDAPVSAPSINGTSAHHAAPLVPAGRISIMVAVPDANGGLPSTTEKFAPDWNAIKDRISKFNGTWVVSRHEFSGQVADILGFFGKDGWPKPEDSEKEVFEAIVKNGRVFRTDPE